MIVFKESFSSLTEEDELQPNIALIIKRIKNLFLINCGLIIIPERNS
jgi:hypothetical protein